MECLRCGAPLTNSLCICGMNHTGYPNKLRMGEIEPDLSSASLFSISNLSRCPR